MQIVVIILLQIFFSNAKKCKDDRRAYIRAYAYFAISGYQYTPSAISEAWGEIRKGTWCNGKIYDTEVRTKDCSFTVSAKLNNNTYNSTLYFADKTTTGGDHILHNGPVTQPITWQGGYAPTIQFTKIHEEATTRGVGFTNWAILDCQ